MVFTTLDASLVPNNQVNILDNAGFEIWQRGTSFSNPANGAYTVDRWQMTYIAPNPTFTISQESTIVDSGLYSCKFNITNANSTPFLQFLQYVENFKAYAGKTVTFSMRVWSNVAGASLELADFAGHFGASSAHPGDSQWHTLSCSLTCGTTAQMTMLFAAFNMPSVNGIHYIDSAMLVLGPNAASFVPMNPEVDLARCQRYYQIGRLNGTQPYGSGASNDFTTLTTPFGITMRTTPTISFSGASYTEYQSPPDGTSSATPSVVLSVFASDGQHFSTQLTRSAHQTTFSVLSFDAAWTASADL